MDHIPVPQIILHQSRIIATSRQVIAGGMPEHVRVHVQAPLRTRAHLRNQIMDSLPCHGSACAAQAGGRAGIVAGCTRAPPGTDRPHLIACHRLMCREAALRPAPIETADVQLEIRQAEIHECRATSPVPVGHQQHQRLAPAVTARPGRFQNALHRGFRQKVLATTIPRLVFPCSRHRCDDS
jgi:hypothetical protein